MRARKLNHKGLKNSFDNRKEKVLDAKKRALAKKVDEHIRIIKTLIVKMEGIEMQELYNGLLANVLSNPQMVEPVSRRKKTRTIPVLSAEDMSAIRKISSITDELYNKMGDID